jgi:hypothetical protein
MTQALYCVNSECDAQICMDDETYSACLNNNKKLKTSDWYQNPVIVSAEIL